jgi:hypothetical protein
MFPHTGHIKSSAPKLIAAVPMITKGFTPNRSGRRPPSCMKNDAFNSRRKQEETRVKGVITFDLLEEHRVQKEDSIKGDRCDP